MSFKWFSNVFNDYVDCRFSFVVAIMITLVACSSSTVVPAAATQPAPTEATAPSVVELEPAPQTPTATPPTPVTPTPESPQDEALRAAEEAGAAALFAENARTWVQDGTTWSIEVAALVDIGRGVRGQSFGGGEGQCVAVIGTLVPEQVDSGIVSSPRSVPRFFLETSEIDINYNFDKCDVSPLRAAGYQDIFDASRTQGTVYPFYQQMVIPDDWELERVRLGDPRDNEPVYLDLTITTEVGPHPRPFTPAPINRDLLPLPMTLEHELGNSTWTVELRGITEVPVKDRNDRPGRCYAFYGMLEIDEVRESGAEPGDFPRFGAVADGTLYFNGGGLTGCDSNALQAAGYQWYSAMDLVEGATNTFYATVFITTTSDVDAFALWPLEDYHEDPDLVLIDPRLSAEIEPA